MKTKLFFFAMLASVAASATVKVTPMSTDYAAQKVTFKVEWTNSPSAPYNNCVWVWIDFCPINGTTPGGFAPATITGATITGGSGSTNTLTGRGFFITGSTTNSGTTVTATLHPVPAGKFNWCVYGSDYPPNVVANTNGSYTLAGTPPFELTPANGATTLTVNGKTIAISAVTVTPATITDGTGYPGLWCPYTGSDLYMDDTHRCRERQSGAYNWEAWIKDTRDSELYRIVLMPDTKWWLAQNLKYATNGTLKSGCDKDSCGRFYTASAVFGGNYAINQQGNCPPGWVLPSATQWSNLTASINNTWSIAIRDMRSNAFPCTPKTNRYGWAAKGRCDFIEEPNNGDGWFGTIGTTFCFAILDADNTANYKCDGMLNWLLEGPALYTYHTAIRCLRF